MWCVVELLTTLWNDHRDMTVSTPCSHRASLTFDLHSSPVPLGIEGWVGLDDWLRYPGSTSVNDCHLNITFQVRCCWKWAKNYSVNLVSLCSRDMPKWPVVQQKHFKIELWIHVAYCLYLNWTMNEEKSLKHDLVFIAQLKLETGNIEDKTKAHRVSAYVLISRNIQGIKRLCWVIYSPCLE